LLGEQCLAAERVHAADQRPVSADGLVRAHLEVGPAQLILDLLVACSTKLRSLYSRATSPRLAGWARRLVRRDRSVSRYQVLCPAACRLSGATTSRSRRSGQRRQTCRQRTELHRRLPHATHSDVSSRSPQPAPVLPIIEYRFLPRNIHVLLLVIIAIRTLASGVLSPQTFFRGEQCTRGALLAQP
jgi:hypothetical protein